MSQVLHQYQRFVTAGGFNDQFQDRAEADTRIWLHVANTAGHKKLVLSPDTDVYHIDILIVAETDLVVLVRLSTINSTEHRIPDMQALISAFVNDPELAHILYIPYHL